MSAPTFAYVRYKDGGKALVPVGLIKNFSPEGLEDLAKGKKVYWKSLAPEDGKREEGYYEGDILMLGSEYEALFVLYVQFWCLRLL